MVMFCGSCLPLQTSSSYLLPWLIVCNAWKVLPTAAIVSLIHSAICRQKDNETNHLITWKKPPKVRQNYTLHHPGMEGLVPPMQTSLNASIFSDPNSKGQLYLCLFLGGFFNNVRVSLALIGVRAEGGRGGGLGGCNSPKFRNCCFFERSISVFGHRQRDHTCYTVIAEDQDICHSFVESRFS